LHFLIQESGDVNLLQQSKCGSAIFRPSSYTLVFFDMLWASALELHSNICGFLGIDQKRTPKEDLPRLSEKVNRGHPHMLPEKFSLSCRNPFEICVK
jgi:hypothetical protein